MTDLRKRFGRLVAGHRKRQGLTQRKLAEMAGTSVAMIGRIENGATGARFPTIEKIAAALKVDPGEFFITGIAKERQLRRPLVNLTARLSALPDADLAWVDALLDIALKPRS
jgi:transcriptional regulator with XRE-family HTH domain